MAVTIRRPEQDPPRKGVHLRATVSERARATGYKGREHAPLCNTGDGHAEATLISKRVTCLCCLTYIRDRLGYPLTPEQEGLVDGSRP